MNSLTVEFVNVRLEAILFFCYSLISYQYIIIILLLIKFPAGCLFESQLTVFKFHHFELTAMALNEKIHKLGRIKMFEKLHRHQKQTRKNPIESVRNKDDILPVEKAIRELNGESQDAKAKGPGTEEPSAESENR